MLNKPFETGRFSGIDSGILFLEFGETYCMVSVIDPTKKILEGVKVYTYDAVELEESLDTIMNELTYDESIDKVIVSPAFVEALLVPRKLHHSDASLLKSVYSTQSHQLEDAIPEWQCINSYSVPQIIYHQIKERFNNIVFIHTYTPLLKIHNGFSDDYQIMIHFMYSQFRIVVKKEQQIQLVQTYMYASPMDVLYYLLKICTEFNLPTEETRIIVSGFIDESSSLYKELRSYFLNLHFTEASTLAFPTDDHPNHFFTSIHNLAACVL